MAISWLRRSQLLAAALACVAPAAQALDDFAFEPPVPIELPRGGDPWKLRAADVTGDGLIDLVVVDIIGPDLRVLVGQGGVSFGAPVVSSIGPIFELDLGDVNGDGRLDLVQVDDFPSATVRVHLGDGQGGFGAAVTTLVASDFVYAPLLIDANEDGDLDILLEQGHELRTCLGDGTGAFAPPGPPSTTQFLYLAREPHALDVNRDGHLDVVGIGNAFFFGGWAVLLGDGTGAFSSLHEEYNTFDGDMYGSALGDFDGDQITDFVLTSDDLGNPGPEIALARGTGSELVPPVPSEFDVPSASFIRAGDLDADGRDDIVGFASHAGVPSLWILHSQGDFSFGAPQFVQVTAPGPSLRDVALADLDGDGLLDVMVLSSPSTVSVLINDAPPPGWTDHGQGLAGVTGVPSLVGAGPLAPGGNLTMHLSSAAPTAPAVLVVGMTLLALPFKGGVLVPHPHALVPLVTDGAGGVALHGTWPGAATAGFTVWFQAWIADAVGPAGYSASNALAAKTQ